MEYIFSKLFITIRDISKNYPSNIPAHSIGIFNYTALKFKTSNIHLFHFMLRVPLKWKTMNAPPSLSFGLELDISSSSNTKSEHG